MDRPGHVQHPFPPRLNLTWDLLRALSRYVPWRCSCQLTTDAHLKDCSTHAPPFHTPMSQCCTDNTPSIPPPLLTSIHEMYRRPVTGGLPLHLSCSHGRSPIACVMLFRFSTLMPGGIEGECCCPFKLLLAWETFFNIDYGGGRRGGVEWVLI